MKINEVVVEGLYDNLKRAGNVFGSVAGKPTDGEQAEYAAAMRKVPTPKAPVGPSEFMQQFKIIDDSPVTIQWKDQAFQRKDGTGTWVNFPGGKPVTQQMVTALDRISPLPSVEKPAPSPVRGGVKAITVTDNAGVVWTKDEDNNRWLNDAGTVANPASAAQLEKRAVTQYQARQMGS